MTTTPSAYTNAHEATTHRWPIDQIRVRDGFNVRSETAANGLTESVRIAGILVPLIVTSDGELLAGHRRLAAARAVGLTEVPVTVRPIGASAGGDSTDDAIAAAENIAREQLSPAEEATAIDRLLKGGYTPQGVADVLAMSLARVTLRQRLLEVPEGLRALWGPGGDASPRAIPNAAAILTIHPKLAAGMLKAHQEWKKGAQGQHRRRAGVHIDRIHHNPSDYLRLLQSAMDGDRWDAIRGMPKVPDLVVASQGTTISSRAKVGNADTVKTLADLEQRLNEVWEHDRMAISEGDVDAAIAAGAGVELKAAATADDVRVILSRAWLGEHVDGQLLPAFAKRAERKIKAGKKRQGQTTAGGPAGGGLSKAETERKAREARERAAEREWRARAPGANLDLGKRLLDTLGSVELDADVARFFAETSLGWRNENGGYRRMDERFVAARLAAGGLRYVMPGWQTEEPKPTKADPTKTVTRYLPVDECEAKMWEWFDAAQTPGEILGRALVIHAAARWASELVVPRSQRIDLGGRAVPPRAAKMLERIVAKSLPASVKRLAKDVADFDPAKPAG